jgi:hypothetical protein
VNSQRPTINFESLHNDKTVLSILHAATSIDDPQQLLALGRGGEVFVAVLGDEHVVLDANAPDGIVVLQDGCVDEFRVDGAGKEVAFYVLTAEISVSCN